MRAGAALPLAAACLFACGQVPESREPSKESIRPGHTAAAAPAEPAPTSAPARPPKTRDAAVEEKNDLFSFAYRYPAEAAAVPVVASELDADRDALLARLRADTARAKRDAARDGFPYRPYETRVEWKVVTRTPRFLSLSSEGYEYTGGAHGMPSNGALVWDGHAGRRLEPVAVFRSAVALSDAVRPAYCRALDAERRRRRGAGSMAASGPDDPFVSCPKVSEATLLLGSTDRRAVDRLGFVIGPYVAGPYAEGAYELTLPVTPAIVAAVRPEYRDAFAVR